MVRKKKNKTINIKNPSSMPQKKPHSRTPSPPGRSDGSRMSPHVVDRDASSDSFPREPPLGPSSYSSTRDDQKSVYFKFSGDQDDSYRPNYSQRSPPRSDSYRPSYSDSHKYHSDRLGHKNDISNRKNEFDFLYTYDSKTDFRNSERSSKNEYRSRKNRADNVRHSNNKNSGRSFSGHSGRNSRVAAEREFLRTNRAPTPQLMSGMEVEPGTAAKYLPIEDLSDSEEAEMDLSDNEETDVDISGNEDTDSEKKKPRITSTPDEESRPLRSLSEIPSSINQDEVSGDKVTQIPTTSPRSQNDNKEKASSISIEKEHDTVPRWSNPDPYTALPPPDESQRKKKDVVKLIRKARINSKSSTKPEAPTDDFISFNFEENFVDSPKDQDNCRPISMYENDTSYNDSHHKSERNRDASKIPRATRSSYLQPISSGSNESHMRQQDRNTPDLKNCPAINLKSDPNLGSRKRTALDEIKEPPLIHGRGVRPPPDGRILYDWLPYDNASQSPWLTEHSSVNDMEVLLHEEILDFYHYVKPKRSEQSVRESIIDDLRRRVRNFDTRAEIFSFGSFPAGLYLPTADLDLVMISDHYMEGGAPQFGYNPRQVRRFARFLEEEHIVLRGSQECIINAKVPLVKYVDNLSGLKIDISFENTTGLVANKTFQKWKETFPAMPILVTLIKQFLSMRGLNEPVNGGIGGFSVTCLVVSLLQHMPKVQNKSIVPEHHLGKVLLEFFDLYGNRFDTMTTAISLNPARYVDKVNDTYYKPSDKFSIIDPNDPLNDIAGGSRNSYTIKRAFQHAYSDLHQRMNDLRHSKTKNSYPQSILSCIIGGNYSSFKLQRDHLAQVYEKRVSPLY